MKKKYTLILDNEFLQYCELNNITNVLDLAKKTFDKGFTTLKYGETPPFMISTHPITETKPKEVIELKPVEVINSKEDIDRIAEIKKDLKKSQLQNRPAVVKNNGTEILYDE
jgi:hypothetical protein